jgi:hypothetical protein
MYNGNMSYKLLRKNLKDAGVRNIDLTNALGLSRQIITVYHAQGVPVCMQKLSEVIADLAGKGVSKDDILACGKPIDYDELKTVIKSAGFNNKLFAEQLGYERQTISNYGRQGVPRCVGMLARLLELSFQQSDKASKIYKEATASDTHQPNS